MTPEAQIVIDYILGEEGGLVNDPNDPGGLTNMGIALAKHPELNREYILNLTKSQASDIYFDKYWTPISGDNMHPALAVCTMDAAVNSGVRRSIQWLQEALSINVDGIIGPATKDKMKSLYSPQELQSMVKQYCSNRLTFLMNDKEWSHFGKGWGSRIISTQNFALSQIK